MIIFGLVFYNFKALNFYKMENFSMRDTVFGPAPTATEESQEQLLHQIKSASFNTRQPYVGEIVLFTARPDDEVAHSNHNSEPIPAIVTRVWSSVCVNLKIIPDCGAMQDRTSVVHKSANPATYHFEFIN